MQILSSNTHHTSSGAKGELLQGECFKNLITAMIKKIKVSPGKAVMDLSGL